jgi:multicomponent Na+:H+ antiporter subunit G
VSVLDGIAAALLLGGSVFVALAAVGLLRFDDLYSRIHAATKAITLGVLLVVAAAALRVESSADLAKLLLAALLQVVSAPVAGHMLGRAAHASARDVKAELVMDHLREDGVEPPAGG